jgi:rod shape-determining protein MreC
VGSFRRYRDIVLVVLLLAVPFFFLRATIRRPEETNALDKALLRVAAPAQYFAARLAHGLSGLVGEYVYLVDVRRDNDQLAYDNARLRARVRSLELAQAENRRLHKLLGMRDTLEDATASAVVLGKNTTPFFRVLQLTVDRPGTPIKESMPVVTLDGAVGTVKRIAGDTVDVQLAVDSGFGVDVVVERTGARGFVRGTGNLAQYKVHVQYVERADEVAVGDLLVTSGVGCRFPRGLPVARVDRVVRREFAVYQEVEAWRRCSSSYETRRSVV